MVFPSSLLYTLKKIIVFLLRVALVLMGGIYVTENYAPNFLRKIFEWFGISPFKSAGANAIGLLALFFVAWTLNSYFKSIFTAVYVFIIEHKRIKKMPLYKKIWFSITFPMFDLIGKISMLIAMFMKVEWKPIPHDSNVKITDLTGNAENKKEKQKIS